MFVCVRQWITDSLLGVVVLLSHIIIMNFFFFPSPVGTIEIETEEIEIVALDLGEETDLVREMIEKEIEITTEAAPETGIGILPEIEMM